MRLAAGDWVAELRPDAGGALAVLTRRGTHVLRPAPADTSDPLHLASFPLVPYANRIAHGAFALEGRDYLLPRNYPGQAHPLHGVGWLRPWTVEAIDATSATFVHTHDGDAAWPWRYTARQVFTLDARGLAVTLTIVNDDDRAMPVSLGFHPYFVRTAGTTLTFDANGVWLADAAMLPTERAAADALGDWSRGGTLERAALIDHCYAGWNGRATIARDDGEITLAGTGTPLLHLYLPPGQDFFCAEPVTAMPDAVNRGMADVLAPGDMRTIGMAIRG